MLMSPFMTYSVLEDAIQDLEDAGIYTDPDTMTLLKIFNDMRFDRRMVGSGIM